MPLHCCSERLAKPTVPDLTPTTSVAPDASSLQVSFPSSLRIVRPEMISGEDAVRLHVMAFYFRGRREKTKDG